MKYSKPMIRVKPPGPLARKVIARDEKVVSQSNWRYLPLVLKDGEGSFIEDVDGNVFLDFNSGAATQALGIDHPEILEALRRQLSGLATYQPIPGYFYNEMVVELCEKLSKIAPGHSEKKVALGLSGSDATDTAMKLARWHTKRKRFISFTGSNHGLATYGALSVSGYSAGTVRGFSPLVPEVTHIPYPYPYRWDGPGDMGDWVIDHLEDHVFRTVAPADEVAGLIVEPIQGDAGVLVPPRGFLQRLAEVCRSHGILLIVDEVQTGFGRTGRMFASEHWGIEPDITLLGKPLGGGLPVSACVARSEVMDWPHGSHVLTGAGHLLGCAGALSMINALEKQRLWENASEVGSSMKRRFKRMQRDYDIVGDVRGMGLLIGIEFVRSKKSKAPSVDKVKKTCELAFHRGLLTAYDGLYGNVSRITPALNISAKLAKVGLDIMEEAIATTQRTHTRS
ncbi:MAG: aminotransferase class III-fold pyridoxal phosphate-dependent enzyme [Thaumarchaeota archaeon]|nr:aminotransferase class III-fold pyridoxal phosphate-dependent enzyme [Nitrososphaerota archaeon]